MTTAMIIIITIRGTDIAATSDPLDKPPIKSQMSELIIEYLKTESDIAQVLSHYLPCYEQSIHCDTHRYKPIYCDQSQWPYGISPSIHLWWANDGNGHIVFAVWGVLGL